MLRHRDTFWNHTTQDSAALSLSSYLVSFSLYSPLLVLLTLQHNEVCWEFLCFSLFPVHVKNPNKNDKVSLNHSCWPLAMLREPLLVNLISAIGKDSSFLLLQCYWPCIILLLLKMFLVFTSTISYFITVVFCMKWNIVDHCIVISLY